uniref:GON-4-like protein n=1 Tax=Leptobrachium leishanense TaxID=445787 RepID=A0A8C5N129_9ANUR
MPSPNSHRAPRARSPSPTRHPPCSRPLAPIQRPPKKRSFMHSDVASPSAPSVPAPPENSCPSSLTRPTRSEASVPCQRPPRTEAPAPGLITPPSPLVSTWSDFPCSLQRPPRIKAPLPMDRACLAEPAVVMQRSRNSEPSVPLQRPPRIKLTAPHGESPASLQIPVKSVPLVQRPPRTNPPCPSMRTDAAERSGHKEASATIVPGVCAAKSTIGHKKGGLADTSVEKSDRTDARDPDTDHKKASPGVQTPVKDSEAAEEASRSVEASPCEDSSVVQQPRQPDANQRWNLSESDDPEDDIRLFISLEDQDCEDGGQKKKKGKTSLKRKREDTQADCEATVSPDLENPLDRSLDDRAKQHNLTAVNVRNILHEVITNEHVVAMMKAAITETQELPIFEPKMTRSKLKEVVEKGVVIPNWNLSPIKKVGEPKNPQFVDIPLEEEDSSDEEYRPDEEDEDETAEESLLESDVESTSSSPRGHKRLRVHHLSEPTEEEEEAAAADDCHQTENVAPESIKHVDTDVTLMGPPPPPTKIEYIQDSMFMEELHAVDEELNSSMECMDSYQTIEDSLIALRTRSKRPLKGIRIGQLEAKLKAPDFTPDMYDPNTADDEDWKMWLQSLMQDDMENEDEADDDDDPEYNILEDMDEPDTEDLRNDRAVRITKKEVSELMEELFETFQDELGYSNIEEEELEDEDSNLDVPTCKSYAEEQEDDDSQIEAVNNFNTPQAIRFEEPLANIINEQHRSVKAQLQFMRMKRSVLKSSAQDEEFKASHAPLAKSATVFALDAEQRIRLQQQMQQHVQLLSQVHLLTFRNPRLSSEADTTRMFLVELSNFAENSALVHHTDNPDFQSAFQASNLNDAIELLPKVHSHVPESYKSPTPRKNVNEIPSLPTDIAWILATQPVFMYPELLPVCGLKARGPRDRVIFSKAEDSLLALGLKHFEGAEFMKTLISKYLVAAKTSQQLNARMKNLTMSKSPDNIVKYYRKTKSLPATVKCCDVIQAYDGAPPLEREKHRLPYWLKASLTNIEAETEKLEIAGKGRPVNKYPLLMPPELKLTLKPLPTRYYYKTWRHRRPALQPLLIRPNSSPIKNAFKQPSVLQPVPITILGGMPSFLQSPRLVHGFVGLSPMNSLSGEVRSSHVPSITQPAVASPIPVLQPKTTLPLTSQRIRKPRRKFLPKTTYSRSTPLIQPAPVIFTVPSGAIKLVNLGTSCGVIQPVGARQAIPVTTVLLNSSSAPINQTLVTPNFNQAIYDVATVIHEDQSGLDLGAGATGTMKPEEDLTPLMEPASQEQEYDCVSVIIKVEEEDEGSAVDGEQNPGEQGPGEEEKTNTSSGDRSSEVEGCSFASGNKPPSSESRPLQGGSCPAGSGFSSLPSNDVKDELEFQSSCMQVSQAAEEPEVKEEEDKVDMSEYMDTQFVRNLSPGTGVYPADLQHSDNPGELQSPKEEEVKEEDTDESVVNMFGPSSSQLPNAITSSLSDSDCPAEPVDIAPPDHPAEPVDIAPPDHPAEPVDIAPPDHPAEPVDIAPPDHPAEPVDIALPDHPAEPVDIALPDRPAELFYTASPDHPAEPVDTASPDHPAEPVDIAPLDHPAEPVDIAPSDHPAETVDIAPPDHPAEPVDIAPPDHPAEPVDIAPPDHPAEPVDIAPPDHLAEPVDIAPSDHPAETVDIAPPDHPAEPVDIAPPDRPAEPVDIAPPDHLAEPVDIAPPDRPAEPVDIAPPDRPVEPVDISQPDRPAEPVDVAQPDQAAEPEDIAQPDQPAEPVDIAQPDQPAEPVDIAQPDQPAEPVDIAQPDQPAEPVDIAQPDQPAEPVDIAQPAEPEDIAQPDQPAEPVDIAQPDQPAEPVDIAQPDQPAEPEDIAQPEQPAEPEDIAQPEQPAEPEDIAQPEQPAEPENIAQPDQPAEPEDIAQPDQPAEPEDIAQPDQPAEPEDIAQLDQPAEPVDIAQQDQPAGLAESCHPAEPLDLTTEHHADPEDVQNTDSEKTHQRHHMVEEREKKSKGSQTPDAGAQNTPPSANGDVDMSSPTETPRDPSSPLGQQEEGNEKDLPEEEEEEDFDDLTQDEDEEELSSASEESVLSVPELQETMEKLTWLASERRLSQEGDSEENSQEENSEPEEEEEEEVEGTDSSVRKEEEMTDEVTAESTTPAPSRPHVPSPVPMENVAAPAGEGRKGGSKGRTTIKARSRRGRPRTSKDASKLLHLYDENILVKDPLREQKDMAFAQEYLNRVRAALQAMPGKYEQFLHLIYQFETNKHTKTAVDLYENLRGLLCDWPQLLKDFAAFLLPEQALECGLFQEHQAFEKSRKFLRQLEICFLENPAQHQKIMKLLQSFADCSLEEISKLKAQMWQLLKGHNHLQEEFSLFFDQLRPPSSRMGEFEVLNWTEDKEYKFDGFEEVSLPAVNDEEEVSKVHPPQRSKRKKEVHLGQDTDWVDGGKDCPCSCHEAGGGEQRVKRCKRRMCNHCSTKACENRAYRSRETPEVTSGGPQGALRNGPAVKETGNCEGRLSFPKGTAAADRLAAGSKGANATRGSVTTDYTVNTTKSRTASQNRSAALADGADSHTQKPQARDRPGLSQRSARKSSAAKGLDPKLPSQKAVQSLSHQPYSPPLPPASDAITTATGEDSQSLAVSVPTISSLKIIDSVPAVDSETQETKPPVQQITKCSEKEEQTLTVCAKNITVSSSGEKVILWTREADRVILTMCQETGAQDETFAAISLKLGNKSPEEVCQRFRELVNLFQAVCATSSDEEEEAMEQTSDLED